MKLQYVVMYNYTVLSEPSFQLTNEYMKNSNPVTPGLFFSFRIIHICTSDFQSKIESVEGFFSA